MVTKRRKVTREIEVDDEHLCDVCGASIDDPKKTFFAGDPVFEAEFSIRTGATSEDCETEVAEFCRGCAERVKQALVSWGAKFWTRNY